MAMLTVNPSAVLTQNAGGDEIIRASRAVSVDLTCTLPLIELARLYHSIKNAATDQKSPVVQFISAYEGEGANTIAFETAVFAATMIGRRVLYIDTTGIQEGAARELADAVSVPFDELLAAGQPLNDALVMASGTGLFYTVLRGEGNSGLALANLHVIETLLKSVSQGDNLIIIESSGVLNDVLGIALSRMVDGSILVVEAERTRSHVARQIKRMLEENGGRVIGAVLNKRRYYIPQWLYRLLYWHRGMPS